MASDERVDTNTASFPNRRRLPFQGLAKGPTPSPSISGLRSSACSRASSMRQAGSVVGIRPEG